MGSAAQGLVPKLLSVCMHVGFTTGLQFGVRRGVGRSCARSSSSLSGERLANMRNQQRLKREGRFRRMEYLENCEDLEPQEEMELAGLRSRGDPFDASLFSPDHTDFKAQHNAAFVSLALNCASEGDADSVTSCPVFYLDGKDGASTMVLLDAGFDRKDLYVVNEYEEVVQSLRGPPYDLTCCTHGRAEESLNDLQETPFAAAYLDGCSGSPDPIINMSKGLFLGELAPSIAIGFTLTLAEKSGRELIDRIQDVTRAIHYISREKDYTMYHVGDDPLRFGVDPRLPCKHDGTVTCWLVCKKND